MSGILDSKSRVIDAIYTLEGRRQMAEGTFNVSYVTFTDAEVAYVPDSGQGHEDPSLKIYFEACNLPQDQITFEANDEGELVPFRSQDIRVNTPGKNIPGTVAQGILDRGRLSVYSYHHGRRVKVTSINEVNSDYLNGFIYSDTTGVTGSVLIDPKIEAGTVVCNAPAAGGPYVAYVGTAGGMGAQQFASSISSSIAAITSLGGPTVYSFTAGDSVFLDEGVDAHGAVIFPSGTLSSPLYIQSDAIGGNLLEDEIVNASFASQIQGILTSSFDNFLKLQCLSTIDRIFEDNEFVLSTNTLDFDLSVESIATSPGISRVLSEDPPRLNSLDSMINDDKLSHLENFMYLPPIVKVSDTVVPDKTDLTAIKPYLLGDYPSWGDNVKKLSYTDLMNYCKSYGDPQTLVFNETSNLNNILGQIFEVTDTRVSKLDLVYYGQLRNDMMTLSDPMTSVYFAGKTFFDDRGATVFVNMFTILFSSKDRDAEEGES